MKKRLISLLLIAAICAVSLCAFACGGKKVASLTLKQSPTVTSTYGEELAIAADGVLRVKFEDGTYEDVVIKSDMLDKTGFDNKSLEEQTIKAEYGGFKVSFSFSLLRVVTGITVKTVPTINSALGLPLAIAKDGVLTVTYKDGGKQDVEIKRAMLELTDFDINSSSKQTVKVVYKEKIATFDVTLKADDNPPDNTGESKTFRFEAEDAVLWEEDYDHTENAGDQLREDGTRERCVKDLFSNDSGGKVTFNIVSNKKTNAKLYLCISMTADSETNFDAMACITVNGVRVPTGITLDTGDENNSWWSWKTYTVELDILLFKGSNEIVLMTNNAFDECEIVDTKGGRNLNWIELVTTGTLSWNE